MKIFPRLLAAAAFFGLNEATPDLLADDCTRDLSAGAPLMLGFLQQVDSSVYFAVNDERQECNSTITLDPAYDTLSVELDTDEDTNRHYFRLDSNAPSFAQERALYCDGAVVLTAVNFVHPETGLDLSTWEYNSTYSFSVDAVWAISPQVNDQWRDTCNITVSVEAQDVETGSANGDKDSFGSVVGIIVAFIVLMTVGSLVFINVMEKRSG